MRQLFIPYNLALVAKEKEIKTISEFYYDPLDEPHSLQVDYYGQSQCSTKERVDRLIIAPMYQEIINWLDSKGVFVSIEYAAPDTNMFSYRIDCYTDKLSVTNFSNFKFKTRKEANDAAISDAFKLI